MLDSLIQELGTCQLADLHRLRRKIRDLKKRSKTHRNLENSAATVAQEIKKSQLACQRRNSAIPDQIDYPANLPISEIAPEIVELLGQHAVLVVAGDTGSGKTTQLPKMCLQAGLGRRGLIGHTQPRRLAAVSVANRIAEELGMEPGNGVGYQVRFHERVSASTFLKLMTDGILLAEIQQDRFLNKYEVIIVDEAHERSLNIDFLLGFLKQLLVKRSDLKLIITSATIDVEKFSAHFDDAPIVSVSGRAYPIETRYLPLLQENKEQLEELDLTQAIIKVVKDIAQLDVQRNSLSGDILVFLSSEREIRETAMRLRKQRLRDTEILPLYARLSHSEQLRIFKPHRGRRIVLATNIAETSITVPGINYVIDTGFARISRYNLQSKVQRLPIEAISQASANQRKGRCGRIADGICIRLYSEDDFNNRPSFTDPEIKRTNLASVILRLQFLRLGNVEEFPFLEPPEQKAINEGFKLLIELNALTQKRELTECGKKMAVLPIDPRYSRMVIIAHTQGCLREILIIVSALSIQDPRELSADNRQPALQKLSEFSDQDSDYLGYVKLWDQYERERQNLTQQKLRQYCKSHFLSFVRMREWREVHRQLLVSCQRLGLKIGKLAADYESVHKSIISGSLNQIACRVEGKTYLGNRNKKFSLFSASVLGSHPTKWIVTDNLIETTQTFATLAAKIQPEWVEQMALHLVKREYFEPHWSKKRQQVMAYEKVRLYGLVIIEKSLVSFSNIDPSISRELFIQQALTGKQLITELEFYRKNLDFLAMLDRQEQKIRRPDAIVSDREIAIFYERHIPDEICTTRHLEQWWRQESKHRPDLLVMDEASLFDSESSQAKIEEYPDVATVKQNPLNIDYVFNPGSIRDGASIEVPVAIINQLTQADVDWAVPGIIQEKCTALIKGLPKSLRKKFIPVSGFVDQVLPQMNHSDGELIDSLIAQIRKLKNLKLERQDFQEITLPQYLIVKIRVLDEGQNEVAYGDSLERIKQDLKSIISASQAQPQLQTGYAHTLEMQGLTDWDFDELPNQVELGDELVLVRYPALIDHCDSVGIELLADESEAKRSTRRGLIRLFMFRSVQQKNMLRKKFARFVGQHALKIPARLEGLANDALVASYNAAFALEDDIPRNKVSFEQALQQGKARILGVADNIERLLSLTLEALFKISRQIQKFVDTELDYLRSDIEQQLRYLIYPDFLSDTGLPWLTEYPRYFEAINLRLSKAPHMGDKDKLHTIQLTRYWRDFETLRDQTTLVDVVELNSLRWMIEEYRVSLFAQALGTRVSVSAKRLDKQIAKLGSTNN